MSGICESESRLGRWAVELAEWAAALSAVPFAVELIAVGQPGRPMGAVLVEQLERLDPVTTYQVWVSWPELATTGEGVDVDAALDLIRGRADELAALAIRTGREASGLEVVSDVRAG